MVGKQPQYKAFISYSHVDQAWGAWLHRELEAYRVPRRLVGQETDSGPVPKSLFPIFRDREELSSASDLSDSIQQALRNSACLIVICSPAAARSAWVNEEIRFFKSLGRSRQVHCLIVDGEPNDPEQDCFPPAIRFEVNSEGLLADQPAELIAADARAGKDGKADAKLKLIAGLLGIGFNELKQRQLVARNRRLTVLAGLASLIATITIGLAYQANKSRDEAQALRQLAETRQHQAEGLIQFMLGDLRGRLEPIGKLDILDAIGDQAMGYFGKVDANLLSDAELAERAKSLRQIGDVRVQQGKLAEASPAFRQALQLDQEFIRRNPDDQQAIFNRAQSEFYIGYDFYLRGDKTGALEWMKRYRDSAVQLVQRNPRESQWILERIYASQTIAKIQSETGEAELAKEALLGVVADYESLMQDQTGRELRGIDASIAYADLGHTYAELDQGSEFLDALEKAVEVASFVADRRPDDLQAKKALVVREINLTWAALRFREIERAAKTSKAALSLSQSLVERDPTNVHWKIIRANALLASGTLRAMQQRPRDAAREFRVARQLMASAWEHDTQSEDIRASYLLALVNEALVASWTERQSQCSELVETAISVVKASLAGPELQAKLQYLTMASAVCQPQRLATSPPDDVEAKDAEAWSSADRSTLSLMSAILDSDAYKLATAMDLAPKTLLDKTLLVFLAQQLTQQTNASVSNMIGALLKPKGEH